MAVNAPRVDADAPAAPDFPGTAALFRIQIADAERNLLRIDFDTDDRSALVTSLLALFLVDADGDSIEPVKLWHLPVTERHLALIRIAAEIEGMPALNVGVQCTRPRCGEHLEVPLEIAALVALQRDRTERATVKIGDGNGAVELRRPTGDDLHRWFAQGGASGDSASAMISDIVVAGTPPADVGAAEAALDGFDPLLTFAVNVTCPACGRETEHPIDLEALAVARLWRRQHELVREVHQLAKAYGWTEPHVLAIPAARRAKYLELIQEEVAT